MKDNTILLFTAELGLLVVAVVGQCTGNSDLAQYAAGAFVGVLAGHLNGTQKG